MGILEELQEREHATPIDTIAQKIYEKQLSAINGIHDTDWYKAIKTYWESIRNEANDKLKSIDKEGLEKAQLEYKMADQFCTFLNNLESAITKS